MNEEAMDIPSKCKDLSKEILNLCLERTSDHGIISACLAHNLITIAHVDEFSKEEFMEKSSDMWDSYEAIVWPQVKENIRIGNLVLDMIEKKGDQND